MAVVPFRADSDVWLRAFISGSFRGFRGTTSSSHSDGRPEMRLARSFGVAAHTCRRERVWAKTAGRRRPRVFGRLISAATGSRSFWAPMPRAGRASSSTEGKRRSYDSSAPGRTIQVKPTTKGLDAVGEPAEPRAAVHARAAASVVADRDDDLFVRR